MVGDRVNQASGNTCGGCWVLGVRESYSVYTYGVGCDIWDRWCRLSSAGVTSNLIEPEIRRYYRPKYPVRPCFICKCMCWVCACADYIYVKYINKCEYIVSTKPTTKNQHITNRSTDNKSKNRAGEKKHTLTAMCQPKHNRGRHISPPRVAGSHPINQRKSENRGEPNQNNLGVGVVFFWLLL